MTRFGPVGMLDWARSVPASAECDLAQTAVPPVAWRDLGVDAERLARCGASGDEPQRDLIALLAARHRAPHDAIALVSGNTQAAFCALAPHVGPGDEVIVEAPTYPPLVDLVRALGADAIALPRAASSGFAPDPDDLRERLSPRTAAVVLTDLHNPSGVHLDAARIDALLDVVEGHSRAFLFVDEVYLEFDPSPHPPTAYRPGRRVVVARSVTKAFGLGALRCGWLVGAPDVVARCRAARDYVQGYVSPVLALACASALATDVERRAAAAARVRDGYARVARGLAAIDGVALVEPHAAAPAVCFPRLHASDATRICDELLARGVAVAPGALFGAPAHVRLACAAAPAAIDAGMAVLAALLRPPAA